MPLSLSASVEIHAPAERIFEIVCTPERLPEWNTSVERAWRCQSGEAICLGSRAFVRGRLLGQTLESETEVVDFVPPRAFATRAVRGPRVNTRISLVPLTHGTRLDIEVSGELPGGKLGTIMAEGILRKQLAASLERLRLIGEQLPAQ